MGEVRRGNEVRVRKLDRKETGDGREEGERHCRGMPLRGCLE
jgi:hypothetical protein